MHPVRPPRDPDRHGEERRREPGVRRGGGEQVHLHTDGRQAACPWVQILGARGPPGLPARRRRQARHPQQRLPGVLRRQDQVQLCVDHQVQPRALLLQRRMLVIGMITWNRWA